MEKNVRLNITIAPDIAKWLNEQKETRTYPSISFAIESIVRDKKETKSRINGT
jgi:hypothetical protein